MTEDQIRAQANLVVTAEQRSRREFMRWILLMAANLNRPVHSTVKFLLLVVRGEYPDATSAEVQRELDYLESRDLLKVHKDHMGSVTVDLTRYGMDVVEYTVAVEPGIARPMPL